LSSGGNQETGIDKTHPRELIKKGYLEVKISFVSNGSVLGPEMFHLQKMTFQTENEKVT